MFQAFLWEMKIVKLFTGALLVDVTTLLLLLFDGACDDLLPPPQAVNSIAINSMPKDICFFMFDILLLLCIYILAQL